MIHTGNEIQSKQLFNVGTNNGNSPFPINGKHLVGKGGKTSIREMYKRN
jgi:hypothetical protein